MVFVDMIAPFIDAGFRRAFVALCLCAPGISGFLYVAGGLGASSVECRVAAPQEVFGTFSVIWIRWRRRQVRPAVVIHTDILECDAGCEQKNHSDRYDEDYKAQDAT